MADQTTDIPQGLFYSSDFVPSELSDRVLAFLKADESAQYLSGVKNSAGQIGANSRQRMMFGYDYENGRPAPEMPDVIRELRDLISTQLGEEFDQAIVNRYLPGQGINRHIDRADVYGPFIACVTFGSGAEMEFTRSGYESCTIYTEPRSCYVMSDESRYDWQHQMRPRKNDRVSGQRVPRGIRWSVTFRRMLTN